MAIGPVTKLIVKEPIILYSTAKIIKVKRNPFHPGHSTKNVGTSRTTHRS